MPVLSLNNLYSFEELEEFVARVKKSLNIINDSEEIEFLAEHKIDGLTIVIQYMSGVLVSASTRGDGVTGDDVIENVRNIIPSSLFGNCSEFKDFWSDNNNSLIEIRGEIFITKENFAILNDELKRYGEEVFSTSRHAASGCIRSLTGDIDRTAKLNFLAHGVALTDTLVNLYKNYSNYSDQDSIQEVSKEVNLTQIIEMLEDFGVEFVKGMNCKNLSDIKKFYENVELKRDSIPYDIDGIVCKINNTEYQKILGSSNSAPRFAIAYKFDSKKAETILERVTFQVGRSGVITPVAELKEVHLNGINVSRVTLHNFSEIQQRDLKIGDAVVIERSGDVVPHIHSVLYDKRDGSEVEIKIPEMCPSCGDSLVQKNILVYCLNKNCKEKIILQIMHFVSKAALNINGLGRKNIEFLYEIGFIRNCIDIFHLEKFKFDLEMKNNWGATSVDKLLNEVENAKKIRFDKFLYALGINGVGEFSSKRIAMSYKNLDQLLNVINFNELNHSKDEFISKAIEEISKIDGIGELTATDIVNYFIENINDILVLHNLLIVQDYTDAENSSRNSIIFGKKDSYYWKV
jgi:DNA ligase (NAD+)